MFVRIIPIWTIIGLLNIYLIVRHKKITTSIIQIVRTVSWVVDMAFLSIERTQMSRANSDGLFNSYDVSVAN